MELQIGTTLSGMPALIAAQDIFVPSKDRHVVRLTYLLSADITTITLSDEHQAFRWVTRDDALQLNVEPYLKKVLTEFSEA